MLRVVGSFEKRKKKEKYWCALLDWNVCLVSLPFLCFFFLSLTLEYEWEMMGLIYFLVYVCVRPMLL